MYDLSQKLKNKVVSVTGASGYIGSALIKELEIYSLNKIIRISRKKLIPKDNMEDKFKELGKSEKDVVVFALTDDSYKALSLSVADLRRYIIQQNAVIKAYKEYYEPVKDNIKKK